MLLARPVLDLGQFLVRSCSPSVTLGQRLPAVIDSEHDLVPGSRKVDDILETDPIFCVTQRSLTNPWMLGAVLFVIVVAMIILGPSTESRFIYTDF